MPRPFALVLAPLFLALLALGPATRSGRAEDAPGEESDAPPELLETEGLSEHDFSDLQEEEGESIDDDGSDPDRPVDR